MRVGEEGTCSRSSLLRVGVRVRGRVGVRVRVRLTRRLWSWAQQLVVVGAQGLVGGARRAASRRAVRCAVGWGVSHLETLLPRGDVHRSDVHELLAACAGVVPQEAQHDGHVFGLDVHDRLAVSDYAGTHDSREQRFDALQDLLCRGECWRLRCRRRRRCAEGTADDGQRAHGPGAAEVPATGWSTGWSSSSK